MTAVPFVFFFGGFEDRSSGLSDTTLRFLLVGNFDETGVGCIGCGATSGLLARAIGAAGTGGGDLAAVIGGDAGFAGTSNTGGAGLEADIVGDAGFAGTSSTGGAGLEAVIVGNAGFAGTSGAGGAGLVVATRVVAARGAIVVSFGWFVDVAVHHIMRSVQV